MPETHRYPDGYTPPEWFTLTEPFVEATHSRIVVAVKNVALAPQVRSSPMLAYWFLMDALELSDHANRRGMHAPALAIIRQCVESLSIVELGLCGHGGAEQPLLEWEDDKKTNGALRQWLQSNIWGNYGDGLWDEPWSTLMREYAQAIQPYAHYSTALARWQMNIRSVDTQAELDGMTVLTVSLTPREYDPQKATRITLLHVITHYILGRVWSAAHPDDSGYRALIHEMGDAIGRSEYLDGAGTGWAEQFWALTWRTDGTLTFE